MAFKCGHSALTWPNSDPGPGLVGRRAGPAEVLVDRAQGHELPGGARGHLRAVVAEGQQYRLGRVIDGGVDQAVLAGDDALQQTLGGQRVSEDHLDLGGGLLGGDDLGQPLAADQVLDHDRGDPGAGEVGGVVDPGRSRSTLAGTGPSPGTACGSTGHAGAAAAAAGPRVPARGARWPARPIPAPGRSRGGRACGESGRPRPTPQTAARSRRPPSPAGHASGCRQAPGPRARRRRGGPATGRCAAR
jgi:hypothetical protein